MFDYDKTIILFGRSPFINEIREYIPNLIEKYHSIGCNQFVNSFETVENVVFFDDIAPLEKVNENHNLITDIRLVRNKNSICYEWLNNHEKKELYLIKYDNKSFSDGTIFLHFFFHTPSIALNWCYSKGYRTVILAGIELSENNLHFDCSMKASWTKESEQRLEARKHLEKVCTKYLKIYQLDKNSTLDLEKIDIKDLLNG